MMNNTNVYITNCSTCLMLCIFGFGFHDWFSPRDLTHVKNSDLLRKFPVCDHCEHKFQIEYRDLKSQIKVLKYTFDDFLNFHVETRLYYLKCIWDNLDITEKQRDKFYILYDGFENYMVPFEDYAYVRITVISYYSRLRGNHDTVCECCGITDWRVLSIDYAKDNRIYCCNCNIEKTFHKEDAECRIYRNVNRKSPTLDAYL